VVPAPPVLGEAAVPGIGGSGALPMSWPRAPPTVRGAASGRALDRGIGAVASRPWGSAKGRALSHGEGCAGFGLGLGLTTFRLRATAALGALAQGQKTNYCLFFIFFIIKSS
jgi:hypothetical protein